MAPRSCEQRSHRLQVCSPRDSSHDCVTLPTASPPAPLTPPAALSGELYSGDPGSDSTARPHPPPKVRGPGPAPGENAERRTEDERGGREGAGSHAWATARLPRSPLKSQLSGSSMTRLNFRADFPWSTVAGTEWWGCGGDAIPGGSPALISPLTSVFWKWNCSPSPCSDELELVDSSLLGKGWGLSLPWGQQSSL